MPSVDLEDRNLKKAMEGREKLKGWLEREDKVNPLNNKNRRLLKKLEAEIKELLEIPDPWGTAAAIPIGYPVLGGHGPISRRPVSKLAFGDTWGEALFEESN